MTYATSNKLTAANTSADFNCNPNFNVYQVGVVTRWTPVKNLTFSAKCSISASTRTSPVPRALTPTAPKPATVYEFKDQDTVSLQLRAQRNF